MCAPVIRRILCVSLAVYFTAPTWGQSPQKDTVSAGGEQTASSVSLRHPPDEAPVLRPRTPTPDVFSVKDYGAVGDCRSDDTDAIQRAVTAINQRVVTRAVLWFPRGCYFVNPLKAPVNNLVNALFTITTNHTIVDGDQAVIKMEPDHDYVAEKPVHSGEIWFFDYFQLNASYCLMRNLTFDSNGKWETGFPTPKQTGRANPSCTDHGRGCFRPSAVEFLRPPSGGRATGNALMNNRMLDIGGWALQAGYQNGFLAQGNYTTHSQGIGFGSDVYDGVITGNTSIEAFDAHFYVNGQPDLGRNSGAIVSNNIGDGNNNGSGIDVTGSEYVLVTNNRISNSQNWCILVDKENGPYGSTLQLASHHVQVTQNTCENNMRYTGWPVVADILVGDTNVKANAPTAHHIEVTKNVISTISQNGLGIVIGGGASDVTVSDNTINGCGGMHGQLTSPQWLNCRDTREPILRIVDRGTGNTRIRIFNNRDDGRYSSWILGNGAGPYEIWGNGNMLVNTYGAPLTMTDSGGEWH